GCDDPTACAAVAGAGVGIEAPPLATAAWTGPGDVAVPTAGGAGCGTLATPGAAGVAGAAGPAAACRAASRKPGPCVCIISGFTTVSPNALPTEVVVSPVLLASGLGSGFAAAGGARRTMVFSK